jgi:protein-S-isoprenylcysteine O-methyltransferase Ste14
MPQSSRINRVVFAIAALLLVVALCLHITSWYRQGFVDWPAAGNMTGLLVLMTTGLFGPQRGPLRLGITVVALGLILPSAYFLVTKAAG